MGRALRRAALLALGVGTLAGCPEPASLVRDMPADWAERLASCESLEGEERDWCAMNAVSLDGGDGRTLYSLCERLVTRDAYDRCVEMSMRHPVLPPAAPMCARIRTADVREACYLSGAVQSYTYDANTVVKACRSAGSLAERCLTAFVGARGPMWAMDGVTMMDEEIGAIVGAYPSLGRDQEFGTAVGLAARGVWVPAGATSPCNVLPAGAGRLACESAGSSTASY